MQLATQEGRVLLAGFTVQPGAQSAAAPLDVRLVWQCVAALPQHYRVFVHLLNAQGQLVAQSDAEPAGWTRPTTGWLPGEFVVDAHQLQLPAALAALGVEWPSSPLNTSFLLALAACAAMYVFLWHTRAGYRLRAVGASPGAAAYSGIRPQSQVMVAMAISGALAGMVGMNAVAGVSGATAPVTCA